MQRIGKIEATTMQLRQEKPRQNKEEKLTKKQPEKSTGKFDDEFKLALVTGEFVFYVNEEECDDNANVIMYRQENFTLLSDNYFANGAFMEELEAIYKGKYKPEFMSDNTEENLKLIAETGYFEEN